MLAQRLKKVLPSIISLDQTGYVKNRYIGFNIRQIQDIIDYSERFNIEGAVLFLDFSKAFDSLEWIFMTETLKKFGFKSGFIRWVETMYNDIKGCILNNGWVSGPFKIYRGIRQGCPISALLFVITVELMAIRLRKNKELKGITIKLDGQSCNLKICQLADDTTLFLQSRKDISLALSIIETFGSLSGLKLNRNKTEGIWLGRLKSSKDKYENINWTNKPVKSLGIYFGYDNKECQTLNIKKILDKITKLVDRWSKRNLTLLGKILIVKALLLPNLTYFATNGIITKDKLQIINNIIYRFVWNGRKDKIKRSILTKNYAEGGLKMIDNNYRACEC